jgi:endonuclease/exonuclease/phosphatase (EEP) superfamily protein YafD
MVQEAFRRWEKLPALDDADLAARKRLHDPHPHGDPDILEVAAEFHRTLFTGNQTRVRQAKGLLESLLEVEEEAGNVIPVLMAGDFNTWSGYETTLTLLRREFPDSPPWDGHTTMGPFPTDHIFFRTHGESWLSLIPGSYRVIENQYLSDHQALVVWFRMDGSSDGIRPRLNPGGGI